jgi:hypothetical protein
MQLSSYPRVRVLCLILLVLLSVLPVPLERASGSPAAAAGAIQQDHTMAVMMLAPLVDLYEGDTLSLPYMVIDLNPHAGITLAPLTIGTATVTASLGQASIARSTIPRKKQAKTNWR